MQIGPIFVQLLHRLIVYLTALCFTHLLAGQSVRFMFALQLDSLRAITHRVMVAYNMIILPVCTLNAVENRVRCINAV